MAGTLFSVGPVQVFIGAEDHPPPHVHAAHPGEGWRARFRFSFLSDIAGLYGLRKANKRPRAPVLTAVESEIIQALPQCRAAWWATHGPRHGVGLVNRRAEVVRVSGRDFVRVALVPAWDALAITAATYDPATERVHMTLADRRHLFLDAGQHIEEAEEWQ